PHSPVFLPMYYHHDGNIQNARGAVFETTKNNLFVPGGASVDFELADAIFRPHEMKWLTEAEAARSRGVTNEVQLRVALTDLDLVRAYAVVAVYIDALEKAREMLRVARAASDAGVSRTGADISRAETEVRLLEDERIRALRQAGVIAARLAQLLFIDPAANLC